MFLNFIKCTLFIRILLSFFLSFFFSYFFGKYFLFFLNKNKIYHNVRDLNLKNNFNKSNIPIMGGLIIIFSFLLTSFIFVNWIDINIFILILFFIFNVFIGFLDDFLKVYKKNSDGLSIFYKYLLQSLISILFIFFLLNFKINYSNDLIFNFFKKIINIKYYYFFLWYFLLVCGINAVNFTDGLDGLVLFPLILVILFLILVSICSSNFYLSFLLNIKYIYYAKDLILINSILFGSLLSFLLLNFSPAKIFLGDVGSLSLGSLISMMFILLNKELYFILVGYLFFIEFLSVLFQIIFFKLFKIRIFMMSPIHHHYELLGYSEITIVIYFWVISFFSFFLSCLVFLGLNNVYLWW